MKSIVTEMSPSVSVALAERSPTASQRTPWLGSSAVGYQAASAKKRINSLSATSPVPRMSTTERIPSTEACRIPSPAT
jgi:hypothetical protein